MAPYSDYRENWFSKHRKVWRNLFILYFVFVKKQRTIERKKKRSKISALESCYANRIYVLIGVELRPYGQKLVQFCKHTHTRVSFSSIDYTALILPMYSVTIQYIITCMRKTHNCMWSFLMSRWSTLHQMTRKPTPPGSQPWAPAIHAPQLDMLVLSQCNPNHMSATSALYWTILWPWLNT